MPKIGAECTQIFISPPQQWFQNQAQGLLPSSKRSDEEIGLKNLVAIHANDSKTEYKSNRDRHENIGEGFIGKEGFENMVNHPALAEIPFILEVPGFTDNGPDSENVAILKSLIHN